MKTKIIFQIIFICLVFFGVAGVARAANIYVDQTLGADCTSGNYSTSARICTGANGNAYNTIQEAVNAVAVGDIIYMRGGKYLVGGLGGNIAIPIPTSKNGTAWTAGNFNTLTSYPGEWAIIDGQGTANNVLGNPATAKDGSQDIKYWLFEKFEVTGGTKNAGGSTGGTGSGIWVNGGPNKFRFLYIHDNITNDFNDNPSGICGTVWHNTLVEYSYFKNNGCTPGNNNCADIAIYSDYKTLPTYTNVADINHARHSNVIRYNLFDGTHLAVKGKNDQLLTNRDGTDLTHKEKGDKVHHNIFLNNKNAIQLRQDFAQAYNNIISGGNIWDQDSCSTCYPVVKPTIYNNTVIGGSIQHPIEYGTPPTIFHPYLWVVNNIADGFTNTWDSTSITAGWRMASTGGTIVTDDLKIDKNYIYRPGSSTHIAVGRGAGSCSDFLSTSAFNTCYSTTNYTNSTAGLYAGTTGANQYITNGSFVLNGATTIANGGISGLHPYLSGVTLPSYIGATNPNDNAWVAGVLSLTSVATLQAGTASDPSWVEGSGAVTDTTPPSTPTGLVVQ